MEAPYMYFMTNELMRPDEISGRWFPIIITVVDEQHYMLDN